MPVHDDALDRARARGQAKVAALLSSADMLTSGSLAGAMRTTRDRINRMRRRHVLLGLPNVSRRYLFPSWQLTGDGLPLPGLPETFEVFGDHPWTVYRFLQQVHPELGGTTALETLKTGDIEAALATAESIARGNFS